MGDTVDAVRALTTGIGDAGREVGMMSDFFDDLCDEIAATEGLSGIAKLAGIDLSGLEQRLDALRDRVETKLRNRR